MSAELPKLPQAAYSLDLHDGFPTVAYSAQQMYDFANAHAQEAARQAMEQRWFSVRDRMPEDGQPVAFVVDGKGDPHIDYLDGRVLGGVYHASPFGGFGVPGLTVKATYWAPLPPPPAELARAADAGGKEG